MHYTKSMKRLILTFSVFTIWLFISGSYYACVIKGVCNDSPITNQEELNDPVENKITPPVVTIEKPKLIQVEDTTKSKLTNTSINDSINTNESLVKNDTIQKSDVEKIELVEIKIDSLKQKGLVIADHEKTLKKYSSNFFIYPNKKRVLISSLISDYGLTIKNYIIKNEKRVNVIGYYNQDETEQTGLDRAEYILSKLKTLDLPKVLLTSSAKKAVFNFDKNKFKGGIDFSFEEVIIDSISQIKIKKLQKIIPNENTPVEEIDKVYTITSYYFKNDTFKASGKFLNFVNHFKNAKKIVITGYSNASEDSDINYQKGLELAKKVNEKIQQINPNINLTFTALKDLKFNANDIKNEGVTLIAK